MATDLAQLASNSARMAREIRKARQWNAKQASLAKIIELKQINEKLLAEIKAWREWYALASFQTEESQIEESGTSQPRNHFKPRNHKASFQTEKFQTDALAPCQIEESGSDGNREYTTEALAPSQIRVSEIDAMNLPRCDDLRQEFVTETLYWTQNKKSDAIASSEIRQSENDASCKPDASGGYAMNVPQWAQTHESDSDGSREFLMDAFAPFHIEESESDGSRQNLMDIIARFQIAEPETEIAETESDFRQELQTGTLHWAQNNESESDGNREYMTDEKRVSSNTEPDAEPLESV